MRVNTLESSVAESNAEQVAAIYDGHEIEVFEELLGEHLHKGFFDPAVRARGLAMDRSNEVLEVACGTGGATRFLAEAYGCQVTATDLSGRHLTVAEKRARRQGLSHLVRFALCDFHCLPFDAGSFDLWWSQEALLHAHDRHLVLKEAYRVLRAGGRLVFSDLTVRSGTADRERHQILQRTQSISMWDASDYQAALQELGFDVLSYSNWSEHVEPTYRNMRKQIEKRRAAFVAEIGEARCAEMLRGIDVWIQQAQRGNLGWAYFVAVKP